MSSPLKVPYSAQWVGCTQQIELLRANGIIVNDAPSAEKFLSHTSYSRFKGYWSAFADASGRCTVGTTFEKVRGCYEFDLGLRDVISDAFGIIEIDLRASVSHFFGKKYGCFGHTGQTNFFTPPIKANGSQTGFIHADWQKKMRKDAADSKETFVRRFFSKYEGEDLPIWLACEIMTFGSLAMMVGGMHPVWPKVGPKCLLDNGG